MIQKNRNTTSKAKRFLTGMTTVAAIMSMLWCGSFVSLADATGTVKPESVKIRQTADPNSTVVGSTSKGKTVTIRSQAADASGTAWYEVDIGAGSTGYIRADLIDKNDDGDIPQLAANASGTSSDAAQTDAGSGDTASGGATGASVAAENAMEAQYATVSVNSKVRSAPSTNDTIVQQITAGTQVIVSGQSTGSNDGKVWYYVTFTGTDGGEKTGFMRSDLLSLGDMVPVPEEVPVTEPEVPVTEPETPVNTDYELVYRDAEGEWYLIDHATGGEYVDEYKLSQLLDAAQNQSEQASEDAKALVKQRIAIVALIVLAVILIIVVIIMAVKLRDAYYADYEDDEDEEEDVDEEEIPVRRRQRTEEEKEETPARRRRRDEETEAEEEEETPVRRRRRTEEDEEIQPRRRQRTEEEETVKPAASTTAKRKTKNFLLDDDEFEFEFLNMDDKN